MYNLFFLTTGIYLLGCKVATTDENAERPRTQASSRQRHEHVMIESWYVQLQVERDGSAATTHTDCDRLLLPVLLLVCKHWRTVSNLRYTGTMRTPLIQVTASRLLKRMRAMLK